MYCAVLNSVLVWVCYGGGDFYLILTEGEVLNVVHLYSIDSVSFVGYTVRVLEFPYCLRGASGYLAGVGFRLSPLDFVF